MAIEKNCFAFAACLAAAASAAGAQGVTISGVADAAVRQVRNEGRGSVSSLASGANATSRIVVRGQEDLGGGLSAGFHLEHGLLLDSGAQAAGARFWDRRTTVSLSSKSFGELRAGRDYIPSYLNWGRFDPFAYVGAASSSSLISVTPVGPIRAAYGPGADHALTRANNTVQWWLPAGWGGLEGQVLAGAGEGGTAATGGHKVIGARLGYASGPLVVSAATTRIENDLTAGSRLSDHALGGSWDFGVARVSAAVRRFDIADARQTNLLLGVRVPIGPWELKASWNRANLAGRVGATSIDANDATLIGLGAVYSFSKRTAAYATLAHISNDGAAAFVVPGGPAGMAGGGTSRGAEIGLRHSF